VERRERPPTEIVLVVGAPLLLLALWTHRKTILGACLSGLVSALAAVERIRRRIHAGRAYLRTQVDKRLQD
jgi:hypothetical protein